MPKVGVGESLFTLEGCRPGVRDGPGGVGVGKCVCSMGCRVREEKRTRCRWGQALGVLLAQQRCGDNSTGGLSPVDVLTGLKPKQPCYIIRCALQKKNLALLHGRNFLEEQMETRKKLPP